MSQEGQYHQITEEERTLLLAAIRSMPAACSLRKLAEEMNRSPATINLEIRKGVPDELKTLPITELYGRYDPLLAQKVTEKAQSRAGCGSKFTPELKKDIETKIIDLHWSPAQIKGADTNGKIPVSVSTMYSWMGDPNKLGNCKKALRHQGKRRKNGDGRVNNRFADAKGLSDRPEECNSRLVPGYFEADTIVSPKGKPGCLFTFVDRKTRYGFAFWASRCNTVCFRRVLRQLLRKLPAGYVKGITADRGSEFSNWKQIEAEFGIPVYFCAAHHPWEKGTNENFNGLVREFFPKGTDFSQVSQRDVYFRCTRLINLRPRRVLGFKSARQAFLESF